MENRRMNTEECLNDKENSHYYDHEGNRISIKEWATLLEVSNYKILGRKKYPDGSLLSTVWLGLDHGHGLSRKPMIFETMWFDEKGNAEIIERYTDLEAAKEGHYELEKYYNKIKKGKENA